MSEPRDPVPPTEAPDTRNRRVLMVAAENDALPGGKVGGIGDVVRDAPLALARRGWLVDVVTPSHGFLHKTPGAYWLGTVCLEFANQSTSVDVYTVPGKRPCPAVTHLVIDHPLLAQANGERPGIYSHDPAETPFASDASKYALFCAAVADCVCQELFKRPSCVHLHDWHAAFFLILRKYHPSYSYLQRIRSVYTIHNLAIQGIRPFADHPSSMAAWYPGVPPARDLADPRWPDNLNPMAVGIRLADAVHTVSPTYADEILHPSDAPRLYGGEGLEADLIEARNAGRLVGILNGCDYCESRTPPGETLATLEERLRTEVLKWMAARGVVSVAEAIALERLRSLGRREDGPMLLTSVSRLVDQKLFLFRAQGSDGRSGLEAVLETIRDVGVYILLGSGDQAYERFFLEMSARYDHFIFLNGYSDLAASALYGRGDLFLMPSSFEPCGIGQMLAMRDGQPCLVHGVGGLQDTVIDGETGFVFAGHSIADQVGDLRRVCERALILWTSDPSGWEAMRRRAASTRFDWNETAASYVSQLYEAGADPDRA